MISTTLDWVDLNEKTYARWPAYSFPHIWSSHCLGCSASCGSYTLWSSQFRDGDLVGCTSSGQKCLLTRPQFFLQQCSFICNTFSWIPRVILSRASPCNWCTHSSLSWSRLTQRSASLQMRPFPARAPQCKENIKQKVHCTNFGVHTSGFLTF